MTYNGSAQALVTAGEADGGTMMYSTDGSNYSAAIPTGTNAGEYTVYYYAEGDADHISTAPQEVKVTITPAEISITGAALAPKTYDGRTDATVTSVTFGDVPSGQSLALDGDYTAAAEFADKNAGTGKNATVTVTLTNSNYTFGSNGNETNVTAAISPLQVVLAWSTPTSFTYDGNEYSVTADITNRASGDDVELTYNRYIPDVGKFICLRCLNDHICRCVTHNSSSFPFILNHQNHMNKAGHTERAARDVFRLSTNSFIIVGNFPASLSGWLRYSRP